VSSNAEIDRLLKEQQQEGQGLQRAARIIMRALRTSAELTRKQMGARLGVSEETVRDFEAGRRAVGLDDPAKWAIATNKDPRLALKQIYGWQDLEQHPRKRR
jgi:transcriptional regulator with XRE-family HTH domain